jgi:hypothetical protein
MEEPGVPYRAQGERPKLTDEERRWFTKQGDVVKGPYPTDALVRSVKNGMLKRTALVRGEDEVEWRPLGEVAALTEAIRGPRAGWTADPRDGAVIEAPPGTFAGGFAAGFFGGLIGLIVVHAVAKSAETKRGANVGFFVQLAVGIACRVAMA